MSHRGILQRITGPVVTISLVGICTIVHLISWIMTDLLPFLASYSPYQWLAFSPFLGYLQPWRILTTAFLHGSFLHLLFNMISLYWVGASVEGILGRWRYLVVYLLSALGGSWAVLLWVNVDLQSWNAVTVGASGAVFGLFGAVFILQKTSGRDTSSVLALLVVNLISGIITPNISWQAHVGGLIVGIAVTYVFSFVQRRISQGRLGREAAAVVLAIAMIVVVFLLISGAYWILLHR